MSILSQIKAEALALAQEQLERLGISVPEHSFPDDEDTASRDILDIYQALKQRSQGKQEAALPSFEALPKGAVAAGLNAARARLGRHKEALAEAERYFAARPAFCVDWQKRFPEWGLGFAHSAEEDAKLLSYLAQHYGLELPLVGEREQWRESLLAIARSRKLPEYNLLRLAEAQLEAVQGPEEWVKALNHRLEPFALKLCLSSSQGLYLESKA